MSVRMGRVMAAAATAAMVWPNVAWGQDQLTAYEDDDSVITVTATRLPRPIDEVPATVTVISEEQIADDLATDARDLVRFEPGVSVRRAPARFSAALGSTGRDGNAGFNIRGVGGNRVLIQVDGIRVPDGFSFGAQAAGRGDYVDIGLVRSVEILRGPASALYGSDGLAGAVSFETSDPADLLGPDAALTGLLRAAYDSASEEFTETGVLAGRAGQWSALAAHTRRDGKELETNGDVGGTGPARTIANPQDTASDALLGKIVFAPGPRHRFRLTGERLESRVDSNVLSSVTATTASVLGEDAVERSRASLDWRYDGADADFLQFARFAAYWQDGDNRQFTFEDRVTLPDRERLNTFANRVWGGSAELRARFETGRLSHRLVWGGDASFTRQSGVRDGTVPPIGETFPTAAFPETDFTLAGVFVGNEIEIGPITFFPALRFDYFSLDPEADPLLPGFAAVEQDGSRVTPRFGAVADLGQGFGFYANYAQGFKAPSPTQVNQFFENVVFGYTSIPNPDLGPETSETYEAGARYTGEIFSAAVTGFIGRYDDFISQELVGGSFTPGDPGVFQFINLDKVEIEGVEARAGLNFPSGFNADVAIAYATGDVIDPDGGTSPLASIDPLEIVTGLGWRDPAERFGAQLYLTAAARKDFEDAAGICAAACFRPESFTVVDVTAFWRISENFTLRAGLFNITDETYARWGDVIGITEDAPGLEAYSQPGRNARVSLTARF